MHAGCPALGPTHMQTAGGELDVVPAQNHKLAGPQPVAVGNEDGGCVPMPPAVAASAVHEPLDLALGKVLAGTAFGHCYIYCR